MTARAHVRTVILTPEVPSNNDEQTYPDTASGVRADYCRFVLAARDLFASICREPQPRVQQQSTISQLPIIGVRSSSNAEKQEHATGYVPCDPASPARSC